MNKCYGDSEVFDGFAICCYFDLVEEAGVPHQVGGTESCINNRFLFLFLISSERLRKSKQLHVSSFLLNILTRSELGES